VTEPYIFPAFSMPEILHENAVFGCIYLFYCPLLTLMAIIMGVEFVKSFKKVSSSVSFILNQLCSFPLKLCFVKHCVNLILGSPCQGSKIA
jgi:hypothetical protein